MKKIAILMMLAALIFAGCASDGDSGSSTGGNTNEKGNTGNNTNSNPTGNNDTNTEYTLSFDKNFPYENIKNPNYSSYKYTAKSPSFSENGNTYFYELESSTDSEQQSKKGSTIELGKSPYAYYKCVVLGEETEDYTPNRRIKTFEFDHYNTKADDSGTSYKTGDNITLTSDTILYCFYSAAENAALDFTVTTQYSMKVGETIEIANYFNDVYETYISNSDEISSYLERTGTSTNGNSIYTAKAVGTITVRAKDWNDDSKTWYCYITITADGFNGNSIEYKLLGVWEYTKNNSTYGTITLHANKTGHITTTLNGKKIFDNEFTWSASERTINSTKYQYLDISNSGNSNLDGSFGLKDIRTNRFTITDYLSFGMPKETTWWNKD